MLPWPIPIDGSAVVPLSIDGEFVVPAQRMDDKGIVCEDGVWREFVVPAQRMDDKGKVCEDGEWHLMKGSNGGPNGGKDYFERFPPKKDDPKIKAERAAVRKEKYDDPKIKAERAAVRREKYDPAVRKERYNNEKDEANKRDRENYQKRKNDPEVKRKQAECKQIRLDARIFNFAEDRNEDELTRKAQGMADELSGKMHPNIIDDDLWYIGGACARRMLVDVAEGVVTPRGAISSVTIQWFVRRMAANSPRTRSSISSTVESF